MKYTDGGWLLKEGFEVNYTAHVYTVKTNKDKLILYAPFRYTAHKGFSLDGGMMTIEIYAPISNVIGLKIYHHKGSSAKIPSFELEKEECNINITELDDKYIFQNGKMQLEIAKGEQFNLKFIYDGRLLTESKPRGQAYIIDPEGQTHVSEQLTLGIGENIYGLGERFTPFVKNGQTVDMWNADGGTGTEQSYKNIPFYLSNNDYGVFVNSSNKVSFEIANEKVSRVQFSNPGETLEYFVIGGESIKEVLDNYTNLVGKPGLPPAWSYGLWLSTSFLTDYNEETVNEFVDGMIERDIPLEVFHFDCLWMEEFEWVNFKWDERMFPDPKGMLKRLKEKGLKICVWINPYVAQKSEMFDEGMEKGYFLKRNNGDVWQWDKWQAGQAIVDFTNPDATKWYTSKLENLIDMGVDSFKTDFGERIPTDCIYYDGSDSFYMHNYYTQIYNEAVYCVLEKKLGKDKAVLFARSATAGGQKFPVHWGGDNSADYPSMAESLRAGLSFGLSGFGYWSHDIGGFESGCHPDIYKRWTQFGLLSSHSRYHGSWDYKVPWLYGEEAVDVTRMFTKLKLKLMPYIISESMYTHTTGIPMMRAMIIDFEEDVNTHYLDRQYMFGSSLLVAPIFNETGEVLFYVPNGGIWTDYLSGEKYLGGNWYKRKYDYFGLPLLVKPNGIIIEGNTDSKAVYNYEEDFIAHLFEPTLEVVNSINIYNNQFELVGNLETILKGNAIQITLNEIDNCKLILHYGQNVYEYNIQQGMNQFNL